MLRPHPPTGPSPGPCRRPRPRHRVYSSLRPRQLRSPRLERSIPTANLDLPISSAPRSNFAARWTPVFVGGRASYAPDGDAFLNDCDCYPCGGYEPRGGPPEQPKKKPFAFSGGPGNRHVMASRGVEIAGSKCGRGRPGQLRRELQSFDPDLGPFGEEPSRRVHQGRTFSSRNRTPGAHHASESLPTSFWRVAGGGRTKNV